MSAVGRPAWASLSLCLMESAGGEVWTSSRDGSNLLGLPGPCPWEDDDNETLGLGGIKPKSSPIPRRRSSVSSCSDDDSQPPPSSSRRVSFADAFGLNLVSVKQFDSWAVCGPPDPLEGELNESKEYFLSQLFTLPSTQEELIQRVQEQKLELESLELLPGTTSLKGIIRVLNICFDKLVFVRTSLDCWSSHFDLLAEYIPGSSDADMDCFSFRLTLVPPFGEQGARVDFCVRYETPLGTFWANNNGQNFVLFCREKTKEQSENARNHRRKSCLKLTSRDGETSSTSSTEDIPEIILNCGTDAVNEPANVKKEKVKDEHINLEEENVRNRSRRSRRKAARLAKVRQFFAEREAKDSQQIETSEAATGTSMEEPVLEKVEAPSNLSTPQTNVGTEVSDKAPPSPAEPEKDTQKCPSASVDTDSKEDTAACVQAQEKEDLPVIYSELMTSQATPAPKDFIKSLANSVSQALDNSQNKTLTDQTPLIKPQLFECQNVEPSNSKTLEKAWERFEKGAIERTGNSTDKIMGENANSSENNHDVQAFGENFTFETIVAPLYHEVFERMESQRRDLMNKETNVGRSVGKLEDGCLRAVTYQSHPKTQSVETRSNACIFEKHVVSDVFHGACKESFPPDLFNITKPTEKPLCDLTLNTEFAMKGANNHDTFLNNMTEEPLDNISDSTMAQIVTNEQKEHLATNLPFQLECLNRTSSSEKYASDQAEQQQSECSPENSQHEDITVDYMVLSTQTDLDTKPYTAPILFESSKIHNKDAKTLQSQTAEESAFTEIPPSNKCLEESHILLPETSLFYTHISSNVTSNFSQSEAPTLCQSLTSVANIQTQSPDVFKHGQKAAGITLVQVTQGTNVIQDLDSMHDSTDDASIQTSLSHNNHETDDLERMETERMATGQMEELSMNAEKKTLDRSLLNLLHEDHIKENTECVSISNFLDDISGAVDQNNISTDDLYSVSREKEAEIYEESEQIENLDENEEQKTTDLEEHQLLQVSGGKDEKIDIQEPEEEDEQQQQEEVEEEQKLELEEQQQLEQKRKEEEQQLEQELDKEQERLVEAEEIQYLEQEQQYLEEKIEEIQHLEQEREEQQHLEKEQEKEQHLEQERKDEEKQLEQKQKEEEQQVKQEDKEKQHREEKAEVQHLEQEVEEQQLEQKQQQHLEQELEEQQLEQEVAQQQLQELEEQHLEKVEGQQVEQERKQQQLQQEQEEQQQLEEEVEEEQQHLEEVEEEQDLEQELDHIGDDDDDDEDDSDDSDDSDDGDDDDYNDEQEQQELEDKQQQQKQHDYEEEKEEGEHFQVNDLQLSMFDTLEAELLFIDDEVEEEENMNEREDESDHLSLKVETGDHVMVSEVQFVTTAEINTNVDLDVSQDEQSIRKQSEQGGSISGEEEVSWDKNVLQQSTGKSEAILSDVQKLPNNSDSIKCADRDEDVCQVEENHPREDQVNNLLGNHQDISEQNMKNLDESASTESLTDDEMDLYLHKLKSAQQSGFGETISNRNYNKRPSVSRTRTLSLSMPSISESVDEDQPNTSLKDLTHEEMMELEKATLSVMDEEDEVRRRNVLWWKEFFSSGIMSKMLGYAFLMVIFLVTAYYYDFIACFGLYLLALYWLYFRGESESFKVMQPER